MSRLPLSRIAVALITLLVMLPAQGSDRIYEEINDDVLYQQGAAEVVLNGNVAITPLNLSFCSSIADPSCENYAEFSVAPSVAATLELRSSAAASFDKEITQVVTPLGSFTLGGFTVTPYLWIKLEIDGQIGANMVISTVQQYSLPVSLAIGPGGIDASADTPEKIFHVDSPTLTQSTGATLNVTATALVYLDIITAAGTPIGGPFMAAVPATTFDVSPTANPWWSFTGNLDVTTGWFDYGVNLLPAIPLLSESYAIADAGGPLLNLNELGANRWARTISDVNTQVTGRALTRTTGGELIVAGDGYASNNRMYLAGVAGDGAVSWEKRNDQGSDFNPTCSDAAGDGGFFVGGTQLVTSGASVARYDGSGNAVWIKRLDTGVDSIASIAATADGGVCGTGYSEVGGTFQLWVFKLDASGTLAWSNVYSAPGGGSSQGRKILETASGQIVVAGLINYTDDPNWAASTIRGRNAGLVLLQADGTLVSTHLLGSRYAGEANTFCETEDGGFLVAGKIADEDQAAWIAKLDQNLALEWSRTYAGEAQATGITLPGNGPYDEITDIEPIEGGYVMTGITGLGDQRDSWLFKIDEQGSIVWFKSFRGGHADRLDDLLVISGEGVAAIGTTSTFTHGAGTARDEMFLVRAAFDGMLHFQEVNGMEVLDVENDAVAQGGTEDVIVVGLTLSAVTVTPSMTSTSLTTTDPDLTVTLRSF